MNSLFKRKIGFLVTELIVVLPVFGSITSLAALGFPSVIRNIQIMAQTNEVICFSSKGASICC
jgi:type II secretory pathway component PulJ